MPRLLLIFLLCSAAAFAQDFANKSFLGTKYTLERISGLSVQSTPIPGVPLGRPVLQGDAFLNNNYRPTTFRLLDGTVTREYLTKYDMFLNEFYLRTPRGMRVLGGDDVSSYFWKTDTLSRQTETFVTTRDFQTEKRDSVRGFFQILVDGHLPIVKHTLALLKDPNFNIALNVGSQDYKLIKKQRLFYLEEAAAHLLPPPRKITTLFGAYETKVKKFIDMNELDLTIEAHVVEVFRYYNSLANPE